MLQAEEDDTGTSVGMQAKDNPHTLTTVSYSATSLASDRESMDGVGFVPNATWGRQYPNPKFATQVNAREAMSAVDRSKTRRVNGSYHDTH